MITYTYRGKTALITGASSGLGELFARALAKRGMNLILVARSEDKLQQIATELENTYKIQASVFASDLSLENAAKQLYGQVTQRGLKVDMLINNAGFGTYGPLETLSPERQHQEAMLNVVAMVDLTQAFVPAMVGRKDGAIINLASTAAFQPTPFQSLYGATKAFALSFSEALWGEYRGSGVRVIALCPGPTATGFFQVAGEVTVIGQIAPPEPVIEKALEALEKGKSYVIPGLRNYWMAQSTRFFPRSWVTLISRRALQPKSPDLAQAKQ